MSVSLPPAPLLVRITRVAGARLSHRLATPAGFAPTARVAGLSLGGSLQNSASRPSGRQKPWARWGDLAASQSRYARRAFTLIEMMIVLVLVAILASVALPSYNAYLRRAQRSKARAALLQAAHRLEREATASGSNANGEVPEALSGGPGGLHAMSRQPPQDAFDAATRFTLRATPKGSQAGDACGTFTLNSTGERGLLGNQAKVADCWNR